MSPDPEYIFVAKSTCSGSVKPLRLAVASRPAVANLEMRGGCAVFSSTIWCHKGAKWDIFRRNFYVLSTLCKWHISCISVAVGIYTIMPHTLAIISLELNVRQNISSLDGICFRSDRSLLQFYHPFWTNLKLRNYEHEIHARPPNVSLAKCFDASETSSIFLLFLLLSHTRVDDHRRS